jgi:4-hydroxy-tetrahydrodipicolinate synthase
MSSAAFLMLGGHGVISVTANVAPRAMHELCAAAAAGDMHKLREVNAALTGLHRDLFCEANPIPVKWAVARMGLIGDGIRLPLTQLSDSCHERVLKAMRKAGVKV